jgi:tRNA(fMet)-specific endonuclease VapC
VSTKYLLDTNILSEPLRPSPHPKILEHLQKHQDELAIATIVWHELLFGCYRLPASTRRSTIENYLLHVVVPTIAMLPYDERAAEWHAVERARLTKIGKTPSFADGQIAAIARTNDLILVTLNISDYSAFDELHLEDWRK